MTSAGYSEDALVEQPAIALLASLGWETVQGYPQDLFAIIFAEWNTFKAFFGRDKSYWDQRAQLLAKIRNPLAHNRDQAVYDYERQIAEGYCKEILTVLKP